MFDYNNGQLVYASMTKADTLFRYNTNIRKEFSYRLNKNKIFSSTELAQNSKQIFFLNNLYGVNVMNTLGEQYFKGNDGRGLNEIVNAISLPVNDTLNLLSGGNIRNKTGYLIAMNNKGETIWERAISVRKHNTDLKLFNYSSFFLVCDKTSIQALDKKNGKVIWAKVFKMNYHNVFMSKERLVIIFLPNEQIFTGVLTPHEIVVKSINLSNGKYLFNCRGEVLGYPDIGLINNKLILSDENLIKVINLVNNKVEKQAKIRFWNKKHYRFRYYIDMHSFKSYLYSYDGIVYW